MKDKPTDLLKMTLCTTKLLIMIKYQLNKTPIIISKVLDQRPSFKIFSINKPKKP